jgi:transposase InsO family protein
MIYSIHDHLTSGTGRQPIRLQIDRGTEFTNRMFQKFLKENDVHFFATYNDERKASIVERFNRPLETKMWKYFNNSSVQLGKYPFLNVRFPFLSRTLSLGENLHDYLGPFLPYSLLDTVVWLAHVTDTFTDRSWNRVYKQSVSEISEGKHCSFLYHV